MRERAHAACHVGSTDDVARDRQFGVGSGDSRGGHNGSYIR